MLLGDINIKKMFSDYILKFKNTKSHVYVGAYVKIETVIENLSKWWSFEIKSVKMLII